MHKINEIINFLKLNNAPCNYLDSDTPPRISIPNQDGLKEQEVSINNLKIQDISSNKEIYLETIRSIGKEYNSDKNDSNLSVTADAWYQPIHYYGENYGIRYTTTGLARIAGNIYGILRKRHPDPKELDRKLYDMNSKIIYELLKCAFKIVIEGHEYYHHIAESFAILNDLLELKSKGLSYLKYNNEIYKKNYGTDKCFEEGLANSYAMSKTLNFSSKEYPDLYKEISKMTSLKPKEEFNKIKNTYILDTKIKGYSLVKKYKKNYPKYQKKLLEQIEVNQFFLLSDPMLFLKKGLIDLNEIPISEMSDSWNPPIFGRPFGIDSNQAINFLKLLGAKPLEKTNHTAYVNKEFGIDYPMSRRSKGRILTGNELDSFIEQVNKYPASTRMTARLISQIKNKKDLKRFTI